MEEKLYRDQFCHFLNITPSESNPSWKLEARGVEALSLSYNAQLDQFKQINQRNANVEFENYQIQSSVTGKRIYKGDPIFEFLNTARRQGKSITTQLLEVNTAYKTGDNYDADLYDVLITINEFLGDSATISYDINVKGDPKMGTATMSNGTPTFTATV